MSSTSSTTGATAFLFPGQGSQAAGMGRELAWMHPEAEAVFAEADRILGFSLSQVCFNGTDADLRPTEIAQPALLTCSIATLRSVENRGITANAVAGHSLGEYSALVAAGSLPFDAALRLVRRRGELMAEAAQQHPGAMAAVLGLDGDRVAEICRNAEDLGVVVPANFNAPGQVVISGDIEAVRAASERLKAAGASRVIPLAVSGAFHSPLMRDAAARMETELNAAPLANAMVPVISNTTARPAVSAAEIRTALISQVVSGVRWEESVRALQAQGITHYVEIGPGRVLSGLVKKILPNAMTYNIGDPASLDGLESFLRSS